MRPLPLAKEFEEATDARLEGRMDPGKLRNERLSKLIASVQPVATKSQSFSDCSDSKWDHTLVNRPTRLRSCEDRGMITFELTFPLSERLIPLLRKLVHPDPTQRFSSAEEAELSEEGAAGFLRQLVLSERSQEYASELRQWIAEMETEAMHRSNRRGPEFRDTTRIAPNALLTRAFDPSDESPDQCSDGFELNR